MKNSKRRLDQLLLERGLAPTLEKARALIMSGEVKVEGRKADKAGISVPESAAVEIAAAEPYVSRGGTKLAHALTRFGIECRGRICADVGAATGGFSDAMLQAGAARVYAVDVGYGDLHWKVRSDPRLIPIERTNARTLEVLPEPIDFAAVDVSFISLTMVLGAMRGWFAANGEIAALVKPQFEALREEIPAGGVILDEGVRERALERVVAWCAANDFTVRERIDSPIAGASGNREYFVHLTW